MQTAARRKYGFEDLWCPVSPDSSMNVGTMGFTPTDEAANQFGFSLARTLTPGAPPGHRHLIAVGVEQS
jgi:hypothetical protein